MIDAFATVAMVVLAMAMLATMARLFVGPTVPDRIAALDLMGMLVVGSLAVYCVLSGQPLFLDPAFVLALIAFLGTVAFAKYLEARR